MTLYLKSISLSRMPSLHIPPACTFTWMSHKHFKLNMSITKLPQTNLSSSPGSEWYLHPNQKHESSLTPYINLFTCTFKSERLITASLVLGAGTQHEEDDIFPQRSPLYKKGTDYVGIGDGPHWGVSKLPPEVRGGNILDNQISRKSCFPHKHSRESFSGRGKEPNSAFSWLYKAHISHLLYIRRTECL